MVSKRNYTEALHASIWLGQVAVAAKVIDPVSLLGDNGVIHCLSHLTLDDTELNKDFLKRIKDHVLVLILQLESKTPGFNKRDYEDSTNSDAWLVRPADLQPLINFSQTWISKETWERETYYDEY